MGIMENKMETTIMGLYRDYRVNFGGSNGIMDNKMETTIMGYMKVILGIYVIVY